MPAIFLTERDVRDLLTMDLAIGAVDAAFRKLSLDEAENIPRQRCQTDHLMLHVLPAAAKTLGAVGYKAYTTPRGGPPKFLVTVYDPKSGDVAAVIQADYLGQVRTGAASGVATRKLARPEARTLGLYGAGGQARTQLLAISRVRKLESVKVSGRDPAKLTAFCAEMTEATGVPVEPAATPEEAARGMDIVATATTSREPVLKGEWLEPGAHVNLVGSNFLSKAEADSELFRRATLVTVDSRDQARLEAGDFVAALREGVLSWAGVKDFAHVLLGRYPGRESPADVTVFKSLGLGIEDVAVAAKVVELAKKQGRGAELPF